MEPKLLLSTSSLRYEINPDILGYFTNERRLSIRQDFGNGNIVVKPTDKKEVNLYMLSDYEPPDGTIDAHSFLHPEPGALDALLAPWDARLTGGAPAHHGGRVHLPANLASFTRSGVRSLSLALSLSLSLSL